MKNYVIIDADTIQKRIEELENVIEEKKIGVENERWLKHELKQILSQSTPLIPENIKPLQELIDEGYDPYDSAHHLQVQRMLKVIQEYLSNLKLDV